MRRTFAHERPVGARLVVASRRSYASFPDSPRVEGIDPDAAEANVNRGRRPCRRA